MCVFVVMKAHVLLIVLGQQWSSTAQRKIYQALIHTQYLLVETFAVCSAVLVGFADKKKNIEYDNM